MTLGIHTTNVANKWLDVFGPSGSSFTAITGVHVALHIGDPGSAGTANPSAETDRKAVAWLAAANGSKSMTGTLSWAAWNAGANTITHISLWDAATAGAFLWSGALSASKAVADGDTLNITALTIAVTPLAA